MAPTILPRVWPWLKQLFKPQFGFTRMLVKRILRKYGYPPDKQEKATQTVLEQAELLGWEVAA